MKKILFVSPYPKDKAPSQRLKFEQYFSYFEAKGFELKTSSFIDDAFWSIVYKPGNLPKKLFFTIKGYFRRIKDLITLRNFDIVYVHLWVTPIGPPVFEWLFRKFSKSLIYDIDDLIFLKPKSKANPVINFLKSSNKSVYLMRNADHVITCTPYLDEFVRKFNHQTTDISSTINTAIYRPRENYYTQNVLILGWSGSHSTSKYINLLKPVFLKLRHEIDFKLLVIGDPSFRMDGVEVEAIPWQEDTEIKDLSRIDIGLYPLPDEEWVLGKSGLKALQYMALGIPTIATAIGANYRIIENGSSGFLVNTEGEWLDRIIRLAKDVGLRKHIGQNGSKRVEEKYSIKANADTYIRIIKSVGGLEGN